MTYEEVSSIPSKWKGPAYLCGQGHQLHPLRIKARQEEHAGCTHALDTYCGSCGWVDVSSLKLEEEIRNRTEGRKATENQDEQS